MEGKGHMKQQTGSSRLVALVVIGCVVGPTGAIRPSDATEVEPTQTPDDDSIKRLEAEFANTLTDAVMTGTWQVTHGEGLEGKAPLGEPARDQYVIQNVTKLMGDHWLITARIVYGDKDVTVPVPVRVVWAGDTPVITVDTKDIPMLGEYSARVMVFRHFYAGTWFGRGYGGVMSGQITHSETNPVAEKADPQKPAKDNSNAPKPDAQ